MPKNGRKDSDAVRIILKLINSNALSRKTNGLAMKMLIKMKRSRQE